MAIPTTALFYKFLGGFGNSFYGTNIFKLTGSGAFFIIFIIIINPILVNQTFPSKENIFDPPPTTWMAVDKVNLLPKDLKLNFMNYSYSEADFGEYNSNNPLHFETSENAIAVYKDESLKFKLGKIAVDDLSSKIKFENDIVSKNSEIFREDIKLNGVTPSRTWFPYKIKPIQFDNNTTSYEIKTVDGDVLAASEIKLRDSKVHIIDHKTFLITIHRVNHEDTPPWVRFAVTELGIPSKGTN